MAEPQAARVVVLDPVMIATSGDRLLDSDAVHARASRAHLLTPNLPELAILPDEPPATHGQAVVAKAGRVSARYAVLVLARGEHPMADNVPDELVDATGDRVEALAHG